MKNPKPIMFRQGDILIMRVANNTETGAEVPRDKGRVVLAYGEVTGHAHAIAAPEATLFETKEQADAALALGTRILKALGPVTLSHEEHSEILIPQGTYKVIRQREYAPEALRQVAD